MAFGLEGFSRSRRGGASEFPPQSREQKGRTPGPEKETTSRPETIDNVKFRIVRDGEGAIVGYKSSDFGRKELVLAPDAPELRSGSGGLDLSKKYLVSVLSDTKPNDPERGSYVVDIIGVSQEGAPSAPEVLDNIRFRLVRDGQGGIVGYKSSELGRKEIALAPETPEALFGNLDVSKEYRVRIVGDTRPDDPERGSYIAEIVRANKDSDRYVLEHRGAQVARARRLRESRGFKVVASMLNEDPDLSAEYRPVVERHGEYKGMHQDPEERHRNFTGMIAGLMMSERGNSLWNRMVDRTAEKESDLLLSRIEEADKPYYVPGVVVGAGVYGAVLATARQMQLPEVPDLTLEQESRIGGQFAQYQSDLFRLNSRRRPERPDEPHLPGTRQSLNSAGNHAIMHSSDTGNESYPHQTTISDTARANFFLAGKALLNTEITRVGQNYRRGGTGKLLVEFTTYGEVREVETDRVSFSTGVGKEVDRLDESDITTQEILQEEREKFENGGDARVLSYTQFGRRMSDPTKPFPLKGMRRLVLSGSGDSGTVIAGIALGYESQLSKTASQLDSVEQIIWLGQDVVTKEEFLETSRARYAQVGLEFPREKFEKYYSRIVPVPGVRSSRLTRTSDGGIRVEFERTGYAQYDADNEERNEERAKAYALKGPVEGDYFIYAHGFVDNTDEVIRPITNFVITSPTEIANYLDDLRRDSGNAEIHYSQGPLRRVEIRSRRNARSVLDVTTIFTNGRRLDEVLFQEDLADRQTYFDTNSVSHVEVPRIRSLETFQDTKFAQVRGKRQAIAREYETDSGGKIYKVGPAAQLPLTQEEKDEVPALAQISENSASIFRYVDRAEALAEIAASEDKKRGVTPPELFIAEPDERDDVIGSRNGERSFSRRFRFDEMKPIGLTENTQDLLKLSVGDTLGRYSFPPRFSELDISFTRTGQDEEGVKFQVETNLPSEERYMGSLVADELVQGLVHKITSNVRAKGMRLQVPLDEKGRVKPAEIRYELVR